MSGRDPRIDAYIAKSAPFARPILEHLRLLVHKTCPDVDESVKWGMPFFLYKGPLCNFAAFKAHCSFGFWKEKLVAEKHPVAARKADEAMGGFGRLTSLADLPNDREIVACIREAMRLNDSGAPHPTRGKRTPVAKKVTVPADLRAALAKRKRAAAAFEAFSPSHRREYVAWITEAKTAATRARRIEQAVAWIAEGKSRNWKYER